MEEREICCCGASGWTRVIAWFQIICNTLGLLSLVLILLSVSFTNHTISERDGDLGKGEKAGLMAVVVVMVIAVVVLSVSIFISVNLLRGSHDRNPRKIGAWLIYTKIMLVIGSVLSLAQLYFTHPDHLPEKELSICFGILIQCFCIWVVGIHKKEIEESTGPSVAYKI